MNNRCDWRREGYKFPNNKNNVWQTACGFQFRKMPVSGFCPACRRQIKALPLEVGA